MDWVDYKRHVAKYREPYIDGYEHIHTLLLHVLETYTSYQATAYSGAVEWEMVLKLGEFMYYFAELENMTFYGHYDKVEYENNEWAFVSHGFSILLEYRGDKINKQNLCVSVRKWIRYYFNIIYHNRLYGSAIKSSVEALKIKHLY